MCKQGVSSDLLLFGLLLFLSHPLAAQDRDFNFADPLRPFSHAQTLTPQQVAQARLNLQAVLTGNRGAYAVINNQPVSVGDEVEGYTILEINNDSVLLGRDDGHKVVIKPNALEINPSGSNGFRRSEP